MTDASPRPLTEESERLLKLVEQQGWQQSVLYNPVNLRAELATIEAAARAEAETELLHYGGLIGVAKNAEEQGWPLHVATRSTCAEHIAAGDDKATEFPFGTKAAS